MKIILTIQMFFLSLLVFGISDKDQNILVESMYSVFIKTLDDNYSNNISEDSLCYLFVRDFNSKYKKNSSIITTNKEKILNTCKEVFIRDNYYCFFQEYITLEREIDEQVLSLKKKYPQIPFLFNKVVISSSNTLFTEYENNLVYPNLEANYFTDFKNSENYILREFYSSAEAVGEVDMSDFARGIELYYLDTGRLPEEVKKLISIVYFKYLCIVSGIDFHKPLSLQPWELDLNIILSK